MALRLRHLVTIQEPVETQDAYGSPTVRWQTVAGGVWASIEPLRGREYFAAKQINAEVEARIGLRYRNDLSPKMKILHGATSSENPTGCVCMSTAVDEYLIDSIINVNERNREMHLMCTRGAT